MVFILDMVIIVIRNYLVKVRDDLIKEKIDYLFINN